MNDNKKVLALKYRPSTFNELIGQNFVADTIINSINSNKIPNAYLFTGIRGVGKTTTARIVAKALNCKNGLENINKNSCENCHCTSIAESSHMDVLEMDAASKTGVDDVRDLIEFSKYPPTTAKYKIFIIDEVHMLSKQAFNALLKTLEEPPEYLKFIFATTEIKKIPVTVVSRCQRFDLARIKSSELLEFLKKIVVKEKAKASEDALKLIVKISEGSVRDALSLLDRGLLSVNYKNELDLNHAQKIFGYYDKTKIIELFNHIFLGNEKEVIDHYRSFFDYGIEPKTFLNDFLELIYYLKNIESLTLESSNFLLNDDEFSAIKNLSSSVDNQTIILFWQFTIKTLNEIEIVSNQNLSIEMFLIRLIYLSGIKQKNLSNDQSKEDFAFEKNINLRENKSSNNNTINQIKNLTQESKAKPILNNKNETIGKSKFSINSFEELIEICNKKKEIKLKYELENNVNLVKFENLRIEISFNERLDKDFVKEISNKLFEWTNDRWLITFSKNDGQVSVKEKLKLKKKDEMNKIKSSDLYNKIKQQFNDIELIDVKNLEENND